MTAKRARRPLQGAGVGGHGAGCVTGGGTAPGPPYGPGQDPAGPSLSRTLGLPPPGL